MLLNIEARIGELYEAMPAKPNQRAHGVGKQKAIEDVGITNQRANRASEIHRNPAAVKKVIEEARKNEDIPTKTAVALQMPTP
jgi:hypothetical protein